MVAREGGWEGRRRRGKEEKRGGRGRRGEDRGEEEDPADQYVTPSPSGSPRIPPKERRGLLNNTSNSITVYHRDPAHCLCPGGIQTAEGGEREGGGRWRWTVEEKERRRRRE